ncbi:hypothetical protein CC2G_003782 [Coprinopsis cinerea AmutBmut pab1-1]|nr:hypothetical protein CC2G_003782 [Coprinopsis cinerea AmutBmut pab1-1]
MTAEYSFPSFTSAHSLFPQLIPNQATSVIATRVAALTRRQSLPRLTAALDQLREATFVLAIALIHTDRISLSNLWTGRM